MTGVRETVSLGTGGRGGGAEHICIYITCAYIVRSKRTVE